MNNTAICPRTIWFAVFLSCLLGATASAAPPRVVKAVPDNGQTDVDPGLEEIRVTFDQDMRTGGYSWVGGGRTYPAIRGKPRWVGSRTCVLSVKLEPGREYRVSINSRRFTNFRSARGEPAVPYPISFTTAGRRSGRTKRLTRQAGKLAVGRLRRALDENYSYRDLRGLKLDALFAKYAPAMEQAKSALAFAEAAAKLLAHARDPHIWLKVGERTIRTYRRAVKPNYKMMTLSKVVPGWRKESSCVYTGRFADGIGYIMIRSWSRQDRDALEKAFEALDDSLDAKGLIIDVRPNGGGSETLARHFAGCFVGKPVVYAKHVYRSVRRPRGFTKPQNRTLRPKKGRPKYRGRAAVLMGPANMSSCEAFLLMMKAAPRCKLIGEKSFGSSGNPKPVDLGNGATVFLPSWKAMRPDGSVFEGQGIAPDIVVKTPATLSPTQDPVVAAALAFLRGP